MVLYWTLPPFASRLVVLSARWHNLPDGSPFALLAGIGVGLLQDLLVLVSAVTLFKCARLLLLRRMPPVLENTLIGAAFYLYSLLVLVDAVLHGVTGIRMTTGFFHFFTQAQSFTSSLGIAGTLGLVSAMAILLPFSMAVGRETKRTVQTPWRPLTLGRCALTGTAVIAGAGALLLLMTPPSATAYACNNPLFQLLSDCRPNSLSAADTCTAWHMPSPMTGGGAARFKKISPHYPLLQLPQGFYGEKQFDVTIGPEETPHVVFLFLESFRAANIGAIGRGNHPQSPEFDRLSKEGILFKNFYATGMQTTRAVVSTMYGVLPRFSPKAIQSDRPDFRFIGIPDFFKHRGYRLAFFHNGSLAFENKNAFFSSHGFEEIYGMAQIKRRFPDAAGTSWGVHDEYLYPYFTEWLDRRDQGGQATFSVLFTVSHHHPWQIPETYTAAPPSTVTEDDQYRNFQKTFHYSDHCLGAFYDTLKEKGLSRRTIVFVLADTATPMGEHNGNHMLINQLYEENVHIPLLILADGRIASPRVIESVASQVDIVPTVLDIFGFKDLHHSIGTSLVRKVDHRTVYFNNPFTGGFWGARCGKWKYIYEIRANKERLFYIGDDPLESKNLAAVRPDLCNQLYEKTSAMHFLMKRLYDTESFAPKSAMTPFVAAN